MVSILVSAHMRSARISRKPSIINGVRIIRFPVIATLGEGLVWPAVFVHLVCARYDVVHVHSYNHPHVLLSLLGGRLSRSKLVLTPHNPFAYPVRKGWESCVARIFNKFAGPLVLKGFDCIVCATPEEFRNWQERGVSKAKLRLIAPAIEDKYFQNRPVNEARLRLGIPPDALVVLYLGRLHWQKGIIYLLRAFNKAASILPSSILILFGEPTAFSKRVLNDPYIPENAKRRILSLNDLDNANTSSNEDLKLDAYAACDFLVLPSLGEGFGIVLLEAMAQGKPVIASRIGGIPYIVEDGINGILVAPGDVESLTNAICSLGKNARLRDSLGENCLATAREHRLELYVDALERVYSIDDRIGTWHSS